MFAASALVTACVAPADPGPSKTGIHGFETGAIEDSEEGDTGPVGDSTIPDDSGADDSGPTDYGAGEWECSTPETEAEAPVTAAEVATTPRDDVAAEWVALDLTSGMLANEGDYQRLTTDFDAVRALYPEVPISYWSPYNHDVVGYLTPEAAAAYTAGTYHGWDCLNALYRVTNMGVHEQTDDSGRKYFRLSFDGRYDTWLLAKEYKWKAAGTTDVRADEPGIVYVPPVTRV